MSDFQFFKCDLVSKFPGLTFENRFCKVHNFTNFVFCCITVPFTNISEEGIIIMERKGYPKDKCMILELEFDNHEGFNLNQASFLVANSKLT